MSEGHAFRDSKAQDRLISQNQLIVLEALIHSTGECSEVLSS